LDAPDVPNAYGKTNSRAGGNNREGNKKTNHRDLPPVLSVAPEVEAPAAPDQHAIKDEKGRPESRLDHKSVAPIRTRPSLAAAL
jgi:hypothetical protein